MYEANCMLQLPISYCVSLVMITITRYIFINILQMECFSAVKFATSNEKNFELSCDTKISESLKKKKKKKRIKIMGRGFSALGPYGDVRQTWVAKSASWIINGPLFYANFEI